MLREEIIYSSKIFLLRVVNRHGSHGWRGSAGFENPGGIQTLGFLLKCKGKSDNCKWFKFLVFLNDDEILKSLPHAAVFNLVLCDLEEALGARHLNIIF